MEDKLSIEYVNSCILQAEMPETGGIGTGLFYMGGAMLMLAGLMGLAVLWQYDRKRRKNRG
ncbi:MAG: LPXTG cell wall anchor domain-containing protein [Agathobacter sp.]|nr:LPXTG cell wall anchor domain-containing protein [Agathobacter sp.]